MRSQNKKMAILDHLRQESKLYISSKVKKLIKTQDSAAFFEDVLEDLEQLDPHRIAGLGVTVDQLEGWIHISQTSNH